MAATPRPISDQNPFGALFSNITQPTITTQTIPAVTSATVPSFSSTSTTDIKRTSPPLTSSLPPQNVFVEVKTSGPPLPPPPPPVPAMVDPPNDNPLYKLLSLSERIKWANNIPGENSHWNYKKSSMYRNVRSYNDISPLNLREWIPHATIIQAIDKALEKHVKAFKAISIGMNMSWSDALQFCDLSIASEAASIEISEAKFSASSNILTQVNALMYLKKKQESDAAISNWARNVNK